MDLGFSLTEKGIQFLDGLFPVEQIVENIIDEDGFKICTALPLASYNVASMIRREAGFYNQDDPLSNDDKIRIWNTSRHLADSYVALHVNGLHRHG